MTTSDAVTLQLRGCLGAGGFGEVYLADRVGGGGLRSEVAVKILREGLDPRSQAVQRLVDEARLLAWLNHPNLLRVHELVSLEGRVALVAEYVDGADLDACLVGPDPIGLGAVCEALARVTDALEAAFNRPGPTGEPLHLLHRDIKPANIRIGRHGEVKLLDFGIAKAAGLERSARTRTDTLVGSFPYLSPERLDSEGTDGPPADVFSLGCTLYEAATGTRLLDLTVKELFHLAMDEAAHRARIAAALEGVAAEPLRTLLSELLDFDPARRPPMATLGPRLEDVADALGGPRLSRWCRVRTWPDASADVGGLTGRTVPVRPLDDAGATATTVAEPTAAVPAIPVTLEADLPEVPEVPEVPVAAAVRAPVRLGVPVAVVALAGVGALGVGGLVTALLLGGGLLYGTTVPAPVPVEPAPVDVAPPVEEPAPIGEPGTVVPVPVVPAPVAPDVPAPGCGDPLALEGPALLGQLSDDVRACLARTMRDIAVRQTERDKLGRLLLVDARAQCDAGSCGAYEREQPAFFSVVSRSDADMMLAWADHLYRSGGDGEEGRLWAERALERADQWSGAHRVTQVCLAHEIDAKLAYRMWEADDRDERLRLLARNAAADWAEVLSDFAKDPSAALALCRSAAGSDDPCTPRAAAPVARSEVVITSVPMGAEVRIDGNMVGDTPLKYPVDHGTHQLELVLDGVTGKRSITVDATGATGWHWTSSSDSWEERH